MDGNPVWFPGEMRWVVMPPGCSVIPGGIRVLGYSGYWLGIGLVLPNPFGSIRHTQVCMCTGICSYGARLVFPVSLRGGFPETGVRMVSPYPVSYGSLMNPWDVHDKLFLYGAPSWEKGLFRRAFEIVSVVHLIVVCSFPPLSPPER